MFVYFLLNILVIPNIFKQFQILDDHLKSHSKSKFKCSTEQHLNKHVTWILKYSQIKQAK